MEKELTRRDFFKQLGLGAVVLGSSCAKLDMPYLLSHPEALDGLVEECKVPVESGKVQSYPLTISSQNWFYREAHVEVYNPSGKLIEEGNFPAFQGNDIPFTLKLENVLLDSGAKIKVIRIGGNATTFTFPNSLEEKEYFGDEGPEDITPWDSRRKIDNATAILKVQPNSLIPELSTTLHYSAKQNSPDECRYVKQATFFCINDKL